MSSFYLLFEIYMLFTHVIVPQYYVFQHVNHKLKAMILSWIL